MTTFGTLSAGIQQVLSKLSACAGVAIVQEDSQNITTEIAKATGSVGMLILLGIPPFDNTTPLGKLINAKIEIEILVREVPSIWRRTSNQNPIHCSDLGQTVAAALQNVWFQGYQPIRVLKGMPLGSITTKLPGAEPVVFQDYLVQIETMQIFNLSTGS